ncbi:lysyl oxidase homolog 2B [Condylostylus longicornis]|uniref:lysyl oxidase homolog 2B n=1 Tax=Condylostylus longicornis TaxID=2530218 RepID=UPI00244DBE87|nr:lysyl oxidase homolog 2B [Condylostylus longicornis]
MRKFLSENHYITINNILLFCSLFYLTHQQTTIEEARLHRQELIQKYIKVLKKEEGAVRLIGGQNENEGNVEILHMGRWGAICDDEWDRNEAQVVCKQLGFNGYSKLTHSSAFGPAKRRFWMDNVMCDGSENELIQCRFDGWGKNDCESSEAAGVICKVEKNITTPIKPTKSDSKIVPSKLRFHRHRMDLRLTNGRTPTEGKVEVRLNNGPWGSICSDGWSLLEANIVCKQLGMGYANNAIQTDFYGNRSRIAISGTECYGNETSLSECLHYDHFSMPYRDPGFHCAGPKSYVAAVSCTNYLPDLIFDYAELEQTAHLEDRQMFYLQCAMEENCVASEAYEIQRDDPAWHLQTRRLLKFTAKVLNGGNVDFRPSIPKHLWEWHMCHMHYHSMEVFASFDVFDMEGKKVAEGHKASFCLEDNQCMPGVEPKYACANYGDQGISVNCSDIYKYNIDCQWIDISGIEYGDYKLKVAVNPEYKVPEMSFSNNAAVCDLLYTQTYARVFNCKLATLNE